MLVNILRLLIIRRWTVPGRIFRDNKRHVPNPIYAPKLKNMQRITQPRSISTCRSRRGALIVFEGCDRSGKTTQCNLLQQNLLQEGANVKLMKFPDRTTVIGQMINDYLSCKKEVEDHAVHLLFSANRWERVPMMLDLLNDGTTLIVDRYAYSGVAFTAAKPDFSIDWCKQPDIGLPLPDKVVYLTLSSEALAKRGGFGVERYEQTDFQKTVAENFKLLKDDNWQEVNADRSIEDLQKELLHIVKQTMTDVADKSLHKLWTEGKFCF